MGACCNRELPFAYFARKQTLEPGCRHSREVDFQQQPTHSHHSIQDYCNVDCSEYGDNRCSKYGLLKDVDQQNTYLVTLEFLASWDSFE